MDEFNNQRLLFDAVREVAGEAGLLVLQQQLGGSEVYVPGDRARDRSDLTQALGLASASQIIDKLKVVGADGRVSAGFRVYVPQGPFSLRARARAAVLEATREGKTRGQAATHAGLSVRSVRRIVGAYR